MPPIPPPGGIPGWPLGSGRSATMPSVVINNPATEAASCSATRTTLVGSMMPAVSHILVLAGLGIIAEVRVALVGQLTDDDRPVSTGIFRDLANRRLDRLADDLDPDLLVAVRGVEAFQNLARKK